MPSGQRREHAQYVTSLKIYFRPRLKAVASRILKSLADVESFNAMKLLTIANLRDQFS